MTADARVKTHAVDNILCIKLFHLGIGVELVEIRHTQREISIGEQLDGFRLCESHEKGVDVFFECPFLQQRRKGLCRLLQPLRTVETYNNA